MKTTQSNPKLDNEPLTNSEERDILARHNRERLRFARNCRTLGGHIMRDIKNTGLGKAARFLCDKLVRYLK